ncbi:MAG TPA: TPM domain-containing protein [bacterium]
MLVLFLFASLLAADKPLPRPTGYVNDFAQVIDEASKNQIMAICQELDQKTGAQIAVAAFPDLGGDEIDGFTTRLFDQWMPGQKGVNNGILIVNAITDRKVRIEVGYGLEPIIPDAVAGRVRRDIMNPLLQAGKYGEAYLGAVAALASIIAKDKNVTLSSLSGVQVQVPQTNGQGRRGRGLPLPLLIFFGIIFLIAISRKNRYRGGGGPFIGGPFIGGGFGGGGWGGGGGGGGFGGFGGGMSGGGGSSGGY